MILRCVGVVVFALGVSGAYSDSTDSADPADNSPNEAAEIAKLRKKLREEIARSEIADVASSAAIANASKQAQRKQKLQSELQRISAMLPDAWRKERSARGNATSLESEVESASKHLAVTRSKLRQIQKQTANESQAAPRWNNQTYPAITALRNYAHQEILAACACLLGLVSIVDPLGYFYLTVILVVGLASLQASWDVLSAQSSACFWVQLLLSLEGAVIAGFAAIVGFAGVAPVAGAVLGIILGEHAWNSVDVGTAESDKANWLCWVAVWAACGVIGMVVAGAPGHQLAGSLTGGLLTASSVAFLLASTASDGVATAWLDSLQFLVFPSVDAGSTAAPIFGNPTVYTAVLCAWVLVVAAGVYRTFVQNDHDGPEPIVAILAILRCVPERNPELKEIVNKHLPRLTASPSKNSVGTNVSRKMNNPLRQPLLEKPTEKPATRRSQEPTICPGRLRDDGASQVSCCFGTLK